MSESIHQGIPTRRREVGVSEVFPDIPALLDLRHHLSIAHHLPGRIRLRMGLPPQGVGPKIDATKGQAFLGQLWGIRDVRINKAAGSILIEYDPKRISPEAWETLLQGNAESADAVMRDWLSRASRPHQQVDRSTR